MSASSPIPKQSVGRTFFIAIVTLGVVALLQIIAVAWAFIQRYHSASDTRITLRGAPATTGGGEAPVKFTDPFASAEPTPSTTSLPKPTPISQAMLAKPTNPTQGHQNELAEQAKTLRERGDMSTALTRLREAQVLSADNPYILSEMAITYEKMDLKDKALELWRRIDDMGQAAGAYYAMAEAKLNPVEAAAPEEAGSTKKDSAGFQTGSVLALSDISRADSAESPQKKFKLKIPLKAKPGAKIDVHDVVIQVFFYDKLDDENASIVQTNANVTSAWTTSPVDWADSDIEILEVEYNGLPTNPKEKRPETRDFFGYIVRVYYKGTLQDMRADPVKLLKQYPPPLTLSNEDTK